MSNVSLVVIKTTEINGITAKFAQLVGYEPYRNGSFQQVGDNGVKGLYRPMIDVDGYDGVCPIEFTPYDDGTDAMMVAAYMRAQIDVSRDGKSLKVSTHEFEAEAELPQNKAYMVSHAKIMRQTIMAVAAMYVKKHYDIDPPVNTTTRTETQTPATAHNVTTRHKE
jgi:hypothetical protein